MKHQVENQKITDRRWKFAKNTAIWANLTNYFTKANCQYSLTIKKRRSTSRGESPSMKELSATEFTETTEPFTYCTLEEKLDNSL